MRVIRMPAVVAGLLVVALVSPLSAQTLGDVAKKEEERRKHVPPATKVYTNKDLGSVPPSTVPPPPPSADGKSDPGADAKESKGDKAAGKDAAQKGDGKDGAQKDDPGNGPKGQEYWAKRRRALQDALDRDSTFLDALQSRVNALTTDFVNRDDPAQRAIIERDRQKALSEMTRLKKQIEDDRKAITDLEEEARRAGVPPGWLR